MVIGFSGCFKDFLNVPPQGSLTDALFPQNADDAELAINAVYGSMHNWSYYYGGFPVPDILSDDARKGSNPGDGARLNLFDDYTFTATVADIFPWYSAYYAAIKSANVVIEKVPPIEMDETLKTRYIAEARCLRALFYFNLVRTWGNVPKVITSAPDPQLPRSPKEEIYSEIIIPDLQYAIDNLPDKSQYSAIDVGRATTGFAQALLAKVYLYQQDYINAAVWAEDVINSGLYHLEPDYTEAFSIAGQFGAESMFEVGALPFEGATDQGGNQFANTQAVRGVPNKGWGFNRPSVSLINSYEAGDLRKAKTIINLGEIIDDVLIEGDVATPDITFIEATTDTFEIECYNQKVWVPGTTTTESWGFNVRIMRYAEVLLIAAEALNQSGNSATALLYLNEVRTRAGLPEIITTDQAVLHTIIINERRHELAMENERFYDLVRTGLANDLLTPLGFIVGKHELLPIPQSEIDISGGTLTQNPGW